MRRQKQDPKEELKTNIDTLLTDEILNYFT
jgi:hypothetical protein